MSDRDYPNPNGLSCPSGYTFHACPGKGGFIGCCASHQKTSDPKLDPCETGCRAGNLAFATFPPENYGFTDPSCPSNALPYTCNMRSLGAENATFWGCCKAGGEIPCALDEETNSAKGCGKDLVPAFLDQPVQFENYGLRTEMESSSAVASTTTDDPLTQQTITATVTATSTSTPTDAASQKASTPTAVIAGSVVGGVVGLAILGTLLALYIRHTKKSRESHRNSMLSGRHSGFHDGGAGGEGEKWENNNGVESPVMVSPKRGEPGFINETQSGNGHSHMYRHSGAAHGGDGYVIGQASVVHEMDGSTVHEMESPRSPPSTWAGPDSPVYQPQGDVDAHRWMPAEEPPYWASRTAGGHVDGREGAGRWSSPQ